MRVLPPSRYRLHSYLGRRVTPNPRRPLSTLGLAPLSPAPCAALAAPAVEGPEGLEAHRAIPRATIRPLGGA